jgi:peroxiredoxin
VAPEFTLADQAGQPYELSRALERGAAVLVFFRGDW